MWSLIVRTGAYVLGALGVGNLFDRFLKPVIPPNLYPEPIVNIQKDFKPPRFVWVIFSFVVATIIIKEVAKRFKLTILK